MNLNFKLMNDKAKAPVKGSAGAIGFDLHASAIEIVEKPDYGYIEYDTGIAVAIPEGYGGYLFPRSSVSKTGLILANCVGVIDQDYRGSIKARFKYIPSTKKYKVGERICQLVILPTPTVELTQVDDLDSTERDTGSFGSTGQM